jgi:hypothetical protein
VQVHIPNLVCPGQVLVDCLVIAYCRAYGKEFDISCCLFYKCLKHENNN